jgi:two-component system response regulator YesN
MPWTVLIADDEPKIRRGLSQLLEAHSGEFTVVAEAEDGEKALERVASAHPDLLLVDIRMPFVDGLEFIERLARVRGAEERRIVVISGHDEFEYARKALSLGVFDYLLKPVEEEVLLDTLRRAAADLARSRDEASLVARARALAAKNRPALLEGFFREALTGALSADEWEETAAFLGLHFAKTPQLVVVTPGAGTQPAWMGLALRRVAEEAFAGFPNLLLSSDDVGNLAILAQEDREEVWTTALDQVESRSRDTLGQVVSVHRVPVPGFPSSLPSIWDDLISERRESSPHGPLATTALNVLERRFREVDLSLDEVAHELQVSAGHLSRVLKQSTGTSFVDALARVRVRKATILLGDPAVRVYEVADRVGYASQHYFSRAFRRVLGVAPSDYRRGDRG